MSRKITRKGWIRKLDKLVSNLAIKIDQACVVCGSTENLQGGHLFSSSHYSSRWIMTNVFTQCRSCNLVHEYNPWPFFKFFIDRFGVKNLDALSKVYQQKTKYKDADLIKIYEGLSEESLSL